MAQHDVDTVYSSFNPGFKAECLDITSLVLENGEDEAGTGRSHLLTPVHFLHRGIPLSFSWAEVGDLNEMITEVSSKSSLYLMNIIVTFICF